MFIFYVAHYSWALVTLNSYRANKWKLLKTLCPFRRSFRTDTSFKPLTKKLLCGVQTCLFLTWGFIKDYFKGTARPRVPHPHRTASLIHFFSPSQSKWKNWEKTNYSFSVALRQFHKARFPLDNHYPSVRQICV